MEITQLKYYGNYSIEVLWKLLNWSIMEITQLKYYGNYSIEVLWKLLNWSIMEITQLKYYGNYSIEVLWKLLNWSIMEITQLKYYGNYSIEVLWKLSLILFFFSETSSEAIQENIADSPTECPNCSKRQGSCKDCLLKTGEVTLESFTYAEWFEKKKSFSFGSLLKNASTEREKQNVLMQAIILSYLFPGDTFEKLTDEMLKRQQNFNFSFYERKRLEQVTRNESEKDAKRKNREGGGKPRSSNESGEEKTKKNKRKVSWRCQLPGELLCKYS